MFNRLISPALLLSLLLAGGHSTAATAAEGNSAVVPVARAEAGPKKRFELLNERVKEVKGNVDLAFIGDSITQGWEGNGKDVWPHYYGKRKAINLGIGGDRTQHLLWRFDHGNLDGIRPKLAVLMIGTNNSGDNSNTGPEMADGVTAVVRALQSKVPGIKTLLLAIFPRGADFNNQRGKILQVNQVIEKLADNKTIFHLDIGHHFVEPDGKISRAIMPDFLHLTALGYWMWAEAIEDKLAQLLGDKRVEPMARPVNLSGDWIWRMKGPNDEMLESPLVLKVEGTKVTGTFTLGEDRKLEIEKGTFDGKQLKVIVRRNRPNNAGEMIYDMTATLENGELKGMVATDLDGQKRTQDWSAKRK